MNNPEQINGNEVLQSAFDNFSAQFQQETPTEPTNETVETVEEQPKVEPTQPAQPETPANQAFAKLRTDNAAMSAQLKALEAAIKQQGYANVQDYLDKQAASQIQQQAQKQGISPELEKRIQTLEQENAKYRQNERAQQLKTEVGDLVRKYQIDKTAWEGFVSQLQASGINPLTANVPLETLYVQHNLEAIFNQRLEKEKQSWVQSQNKVTENAPITTPQGVTPPSNPTKPTEVNWRNMASQKFKTK